MVTGDDFDKIIYRRVNGIYDDVVQATVGILLMDASIEENKKRFFNYINDYNSNVGNRMDFFIPGFEEKGGLEKFKNGENNRWFDMYSDAACGETIDMERYQFSQERYQNAINSIGKKIKNENILHENPGAKLVLLDVETRPYDQTVEYRNYQIIDIENTDTTALTKQFSKIVGEVNKGYRLIKNKNYQTCIIGIDAKKIVAEIAKNLAINVITSVVLGGSIVFS